MFEGFETSTVDVGETTVFVRFKGSGAPLLLLHGFPETHAMWREIAPALAEEFTVICADLRGYGASGKPPSDPHHAPYAKSAMALDLVRMMDRRDFRRFAIAGHDRGGRVAYRLALDHPDRVARLAVLDMVPTSDVLDHVDVPLMLGFWPWSLLAQPAPFPERLLEASADAFVDAAFEQWGSDPQCFPSEVREIYAAAYRDPANAHALCEEYRAATTLDYAQDHRDRAAGRRIACPTLALWAAGGSVDTWYADVGGPLAIWRQWASEVEGRVIGGGHFFAEQNPAETSAELRRFFRGAA